MPQHGQHIVIIGGSKGLGLELAKAAHALGCQVTIAGRDERAAADAAYSMGKECRSGSCDLGDWASIEAFIASCGPIDHLILTAVERESRTIDDFRPADSARALLMKSVGYASAVHYSLKKFRDNASVVMFGGLSMWKPSPGSITLSMANAAIIGLMNSLVLEIAPIRMNTVVPGLVGDAAASRAAAPERAAAVEILRAQTPSQRLATTRDIVSATFALIDNDSINGAALVVDGGLSVT